MTQQNQDKLNSFLKYFNSILMTFITMLLVYGAATVNNLSEKIDDMNVKIEKEIIQRETNSVVLKDHEKRLRYIENNITNTKSWIDKYFKRKDS